MSPEASGRDPNPNTEYEENFIQNRRGVGSSRQFLGTLPGVIIIAPPKRTKTT